MRGEEVSKAPGLAGAETAMGEQEDNDQARRTSPKRGVPGVL